MVANTSGNNPALALGHYKAVIRPLSEATILLDGSGKLLALNPAAVSLLGPESLTWAGDCIYKYLHSGANEFREYVLMCSRTRQLMVGAATLRSGNQNIDLKCKGAVLTPRSEDEEATVILQLFPKAKGNAQFIALKARIEELNAQVIKRQRLELDLRAQKERLQVILQSIGDAVIITDTDGLVTFLNPIAETLTGWEAGSALGMPFAEIFHVVDEVTRQTVGDPIEQVVRENCIVNLANNCVLLHRNGVERPIVHTAAPIEFNGKLEGVVVVFHDVSMKREFERQLIDRAEKLEAENQQQNTFLAMLAHELRNPLAPISNAVHLLVSDASSQIALDILQRQVGYLTQLTNSLLDVSRMTHGKIHPSLEETNICDLVSSACEDFSMLFADKGVSLHLTVPQEPLFIMADPVRIAQVFTNLLGNSLKFTPSQGRVDVSLEDSGGSVIIRVSDTGIGIDPKVLPNLFRPFMQGEQTLARSYGGLGLGLAMVKEILTLHGGSASVESEGKDKGTTVTVKLPLIRQGAAQRAVAAAGTALGKTILLIEDNLYQAETLSLLLQSFGGTVHTAADGMEGIEKAALIRPDIIICDIGLPKLDGFSVARSLRGDERTRSTLMIALTGYGQEDFVEQAKQAGFDGYYVKPMKIEDIRKLTRTVEDAPVRDFQV